MKISKFKDVGQDLLEALSRYYAVFFSALISSIGYLVFTNLENNPEKEYLPYLLLGIVGMLGISLSFALHMWQEQKKWRFPIPLLGLLALGTLYFFLPFHGSIESPMSATTLLVLGVSFHLLVAYLPFSARSANDEHFWNYNKSLFIFAVQTAIFSIVLWAAVMLAFSAVENLFSLKLYYNTFAYTTVLILVLGSSVIYLLFAKKGMASLSKGDTYPMILSFFVQYILVPILLLYGVILYLYGLKILLEWELPRGWVSYLVIAYSGTGILAHLLIQPLEDEIEKPWVKAFSRIFFLSLLPLLILLFVGIITRIGEYGFTERRYYVLLIAIGILAITINNLTKAGIKYIPAILLALSLGSLVMPYINVFSVSVRSQTKYWNETIADNQLLDDSGKLNVQKVESYALASQLSDQMYYLLARNQQDVLYGVLNEEQTSFIHQQTESNHLGAYRLIRMFPNAQSDFSNVYGETKNIHLSSYKSSSLGIHTEGFQMVFTEQRITEYALVLPNMEGQILFTTKPAAWKSKNWADALTVEWRKDGELQASNSDLGLWLETLWNKYPGSSKGWDIWQLEDESTTFSVGDYELKLDIIELNFLFEEANSLLPKEENLLKIDLAGHVLLRKLP